MFIDCSGCVCLEEERVIFYRCCSLCYGCCGVVGIYFFVNLYSSFRFF